MAAAAAAAATSEVAVADGAVLEGPRITAQAAAVLDISTHLAQRL
jgi:hypothetical protein